MISVAGNQYSVSDSTRRRTVEVQNHPTEVRIFEGGTLIASHPVLEGRGQRSVDPAHRKAPPVQPSPRPMNGLHRPLGLCDAVGQRLAAGAGR